MVNMKPARTSYAANERNARLRSAPIAKIQGNETAPRVSACARSGRVPNTVTSWDGSLYWQRPDQRRIHEAEDSHASGDAERQHDDGGAGEAAMCQKLTDSEAEILKPVLDKVHATHVAAQPPFAARRRPMPARLRSERPHAPSLARYRRRFAVRGGRVTHLRGPAQPDPGGRGTAIAAVLCGANATGAWLHLFQPHDAGDCSGRVVPSRPLHVRAPVGPPATACRTWRGATVSATCHFAVIQPSCSSLCRAG